MKIETLIDRLRSIAKRKPGADVQFDDVTYPRRCPINSVDVKSGREQNQDVIVVLSNGFNR